MVNIITASDIWKTSKESHVFMASKHYKWIENFDNKKISITLHVGSLEELHRLMRAIDHEETIEKLIQAYDIGFGNKAITIQSNGQLILRKFNKTIEIQDLSKLNLHRFNNPAYLSNKEILAERLIKLLLPSLNPKDSDQPSTISIEVIYDNDRAITPQFVQTSWLTQTLPKFLQLFENVFTNFKQYCFPTPLIIEQAPVLEPKGKRGKAILLDDFISQGELPPNLQKNWLQTNMPDWLTFYILTQYIPALGIAKQDNQEMAARARAAKLKLTRINQKTLAEKREEFEASIQDKHPKCSFKHMTITTADGVKLDTFAIFNAANSHLLANQQKWIVFFNTADSAYENNLPALCKIVEDSGANLYTGNYRGIGNSGGKPTQSREVTLDGETMVQHLLQSGILPENILVHGFSMGGGIATEVVAMHPGMHLCNDRSFTTLTECLNLIVPTGILKYLSDQITFKRWEFNSIDNLEKITGKVLVIASLIESTILGKAKLGVWVSRCTGFLERKVIWLTERYLDEPSEVMRASRAHSDPITTTSKYQEYLGFVQNALDISSKD